MRQFIPSNINKTIVSIAGLAILSFTLGAIFAPEQLKQMSEQLLATITGNYSNLVLVTVDIFVIAIIIIAISKYGKIKIGGQDAKPEFGYGSWVAMLFAAGMGIGLVFWGVAEPLEHFASSGPIYTNSGEVNQALATTLFNWGIHAWAIYGLLAIFFGYYTYNLNLPLAPRSLLYPMIGEKIYGTIGDIVDGLSIIVIIAGLATSLGLGAQQINAGLNYLLAIPLSVKVQIVLIIVITGIATLSVVSGLDKGIKFLSNLNLRLAVGFMVVILLLGPTIGLTKHLLASTAVYFVGLPHQSVSLLSATDIEWKAAWPVFYMTWWISFSPSVGIFIARISKGRSIRELAITVVLVPTFITILWIAIFGGTSIAVLNANPGSAAILTSDPATSFFKVLTLANVADILRPLFAIVYITLMVIFFVTSADSGAMIVDQIANKVGTESKAINRAMWAMSSGLIAAMIMYVGGEDSLQTLQSLVISTGLIFGIFILVSLGLFSVQLVKREK